MTDQPVRLVYGEHEWVTRPTKNRSTAAMIVHVQRFKCGKCGIVSQRITEAARAGGSPYGFSTAFRWRPPGRGEWLAGHGPSECASKDSGPRIDVESFDATLKEIYAPGGPTERGKALLAAHEAERAARNKDIATLIDEQGRPTSAGLNRIGDLTDIMWLVRGADHEDNTGASCRIDLDGHDCCSICNRVEDMLRATAKYYEVP